MYVQRCAFAMRGRASHPAKTGLPDQLKEVREEVMGSHKERRVKARGGPFAATESTKMTRGGGDGEAKVDEPIGDKERATSQEHHDSPRDMGPQPKVAFKEIQTPPSQTKVFL